MMMQCPFCGSAQIQSHPVVYAAGSQSVQLNHVGTVDGQLVQGFSHGTQRTALAQRCAPPAPPSPMPFVVAYGMGGLIMYLSFETCSLVSQQCAFRGLATVDWKWTLGGLAVVGVGWLLMKSWYQETKVYSAAKQCWQNTWFCHGCGQSHTRT